MLAALGQGTLVCGLAGGPTGDAIAAELDAAGLEAVLAPIGGHSRRTVAIVDDTVGDATGFWEPGPTVTDDEWSEFLRISGTVVGDARAVVLSGSLPPGVPPTRTPSCAAGRRMRASRPSSTPTARPCKPASPAMPPSSSPTATS